MVDVLGDGTFAFTSANCKVGGNGRLDGSSVAISADKVEQDIGFRNAGIGGVNTHIGRNGIAVSLGRSRISLSTTNGAKKIVT